MTEIANEALTRAHLPGPAASWQDLERFALTFDGYRHLGPRLGELAEQHRAAGTVPKDLSELRGCLFLEQRRWRHFQSVPDAAGLRHILALVEGIWQQLPR